MEIKIKESKMGRQHFYLLIGLILLFMSCNQNRVYEDYQGMETQSWNIDDTVSFKINQGLNFDKTVFIFKYNNEYEYRNLYIRYILEDSLGVEIESRLINVPLFESTTGKPLGKGYGNTFSFFDTLPINNEIGFHQIHFIQYMRVDNLKGIEAIGLKLIKN
ncbi:gliding motility lipoprotein GldH [Shivajiella indica]|uniref:Gliding motility lipoprotein GldH n=1 Tax=Shivajiella indica TaxID=872115 RepID=A0ABW5BAV8_9BACT